MHTVIVIIDCIFNLFCCKFAFILLFCQDECSFVSLRDVDRTLQVMMWFYHHGDLFNLIDEKAASNLESEEVELPRVRVII